MAAVFALVSKNQTLRLAFESLFFASAVFWFRSVGGFWPALFLVVMFLYSYFRPFAQSGRFLVASLAVVILPFIISPLGYLEVYFAVFVGFLLYLILGIKDLHFIKRKLWSQVLYFLIFGAIIYFYFLEPTIKNQAVVFIFLALLFREVYAFLTEYHQTKNLLIGLIYALLFVETSWVVSLLPLSPFIAAALVVLILFVVHDAAFNYQSDMLKKIILRDLALFILLSAVIFFFMRWRMI